MRGDHIPATDGHERGSERSDEVSAEQAQHITCTGCGVVLARVGEQGGVYPLEGVRVTIEGRRVDLQCPRCAQWHRLRIDRLAA